MADQLVTQSLSSMTGFARHEGEHANHRWVWEVRSVNGRGLEVRTRIPHGFEDLDMSLKPLAGKTLSRGSVNASLTLTHDAGATSIAVNDQALSDVLAMIASLQAANPNLAAPTPEGILSLRGVLDSKDDTLNEQDRKALSIAIKDSFVTAIAKLDKARRDEGAALAAILNAQIDEAEKLSGQARAMAAKSVARLHEKLQVQINDLVGDGVVAPERLAQEVAILAVKADICEELDRLDAHVAAARTLMQTKGAVGRKFDFLVQEFNREANTLCSKAADIELKQVGLDLKAVIDQMREQIQNVE